MREPDYLESTIRTYDANVRKYAESTSAFPRQGLQPELERFLSLLPPGGRVLDAGCAYGRDIVDFLDRGFRAAGIDLSQGQLAEARRRLPDVEFLPMDVRRLDFPDASFDGIWARAVLLHLTLPDIRLALAEFRRVLRPGGGLFLYMKQGSGSRIIEEPFTATGSRHFTFVGEDQLRTLVEGAGFAVLSLEALNERQRFGPQYRDLQWLALIACRP